MASPPTEGLTRTIINNVKCEWTKDEIPVPLPPEFDTKFDVWERNSTSVNILVTGKTGTGKSRLVNKLVGERVSTEGEVDQIDPVTTSVKSYEPTGKYPGETITVTVWDSPGLEDGSKNEKKYLEDIAKNCKNIDLFVYCIRMSQGRFVKGSDNSDVNAMKRLTEKLGESLWENAIIVLTFADDIVTEAKYQCSDEAEKEDFFKEKLTVLKNTIEDRLEQEVRLSKKTVENIRILPASKKKKLPYVDQENWLTHLWLQAVYAMKSRARPAMIKVNQHRFTTQGERQEISKQKDLVFQEKAMELSEICNIPPNLGKVYGECKRQGKTCASLLIEFFWISCQVDDHDYHVHITAFPRIAVPTSDSGNAET